MDAHVRPGQCPLSRGFNEAEARTRLGNRRSKAQKQSKAKIPLF
jgi:hypothetical protein